MLFLRKPRRKIYLNRNKRTRNVKRFVNGYLKIGTAQIEDENYINSNVQVPDVCDFEKGANRYIFTKPGQLVAAVGMDKQNILIAYKRLDDDCDPEYKLKVLNSGPASAVLLAQPMCYIDKNENSDFVSMQDPRKNNIKLYELPFSNDIKIFKHYVPVVKCKRFTKGMVM